MRKEDTNIDGLVILNPDLYSDDRGYFFESFNEKWFSENVADIKFVQCNESRSSYGVSRGFHFQKPPFAQSKLVSCVKGVVADFALDIRKGSPTYGKHVCVVLSEYNHSQFFIPRGFAHAFCALTDDVVFQYKCDNFYNKESEGGISMFDGSLTKDLYIPMPNLIVSDKDMQWPKLEEFDSPFDY